MIQKGQDMLKVTELSYGFPQKDLYNKISFTVEDGQHCVLIGTNGTGKSTLLQMLLEPQEYLYEGKIDLDAINGKKAEPKKAGKPVEEKKPEPTPAPVAEKKVEQPKPTPAFTLEM